MHFYFRTVFGELHADALVPILYLSFAYTQSLINISDFWTLKLLCDQHIALPSGVSALIPTQTPLSVSWIAMLMGL